MSYERNLKRDDPRNHTKPFEFFVPFSVASWIISRSSTRKISSMNGKVMRSVICALVATLCISACQTKREGAQEAGNAKQESNAQSNSQSMSQAVGVAPSDETRVFRGSIDYKYKIEMRLVRAGDRLSGTYAYEKVGTNINLSGTIDGKGNFTLRESDNGGNQTGEFRSGARRNLEEDE
jgi:hypothetical protein